MSVVITTYTLASGLMAQGMNWWQAMVTILLGNTIVLIPMILNAHAGTKYGMSFPVLCRASFGVRGANVPAMLRAIVACGWFGIQTWIGALALDALFTRGVAGLGERSRQDRHRVRDLLGHPGRHHPQGHRRHQDPRELVGAAVVRRWRAAALVGHRPRRRPRTHPRRVGEAAARATRRSGRSFPAALTANVGYWATLSLNIPDFTRYAKSQRSQALGQALGLPTTMTAFAFIGVAVTSATIVIFGAADVGSGRARDEDRRRRRSSSSRRSSCSRRSCTTNMAANVVSPSNDFSNLSPRRISYVTGGLITAVIGIVMMPWKLYSDAAAYIFTWLLGYSSLMGALGGILIADYWVLRRQQLDVHGSVPRAWPLHVPRRREPAGDRRAGARDPAGGARVHPRGVGAGRHGGEPELLRSICTRTRGS